MNTVKQSLYSKKDYWPQPWISDYVLEKEVQVVLLPKYRYWVNHRRNFSIENNQRKNSTSEKMTNGHSFPPIKSRFVYG